MKKEKGFWDGPVVGKLGLEDAWVTWYLIPHFLSGFVLYGIARRLFPFQSTLYVAVVASLIHLIYEIKDMSAYFEVRWAIDVKQFQYRYMWLPLQNMRDPGVFKVGDNYPVNSVLDQLVAQMGIYLAARGKFSGATYVFLFFLWVFSLVACSYFKTLYIYEGLLRQA